MTTTTESKAPFWLPNGCPSWCVWTDFHEDGDHPEDRKHYSAEEFVETTGEPERIVVDLRQREGEAAPEVSICLQDKPPWVNLTPDEARRLAEALVRVADFAEGGGTALLARKSGGS